MIEHFVTAPQWEWYIVWYFFLGGIAGGVYALGAILRLMGDERDAPIARLAFLLCLPILVICPILLTLDLGRPLRFWHMLIDSRTFTLNFKYWSPMSVGVWVLLIFGVFALISFLEALANLRTGRAPFLVGGLGRAVVAVGAVFGLFLAGYTGVLLSVSNQPVWSDTWALGALFLASGLSVAAATLSLVSRLGRHERSAEAKLTRADRYFTVLELASHFFTAAMRVALTPPRGRVECAFSAQNKLCNESDCKFYPAVPPTRMEPRLAVVG